MDRDKIIKDFVELHKIIYNLHEQVAKFQWINVKERVPEDAYFVLGYEDTGLKRVVCFFENRWEDHLDHVIEGITHWMPLPEPPEEK